MHELQRMQYLDAMGIDSFVPRVILPHCKAATLCELPVAIADEQGESFQGQNPESHLDSHRGASVGGHAKDHAAVMKPASAIVSSLLEQTEHKSGSSGVQNTSAGPKDMSRAGDSNVGSEFYRGGKDRAQNSDEKQISQYEDVSEGAAQTGQPIKPGDSAVATPSAEPVAFSLSLWRIGENIQVVDSHQAGEALPTHKLLHNIANGMKFVQANLAGAEILHWPLVGTQDASWQAAEQMVQGFLDGKLAAAPIECFWLMGHDATRAVLGNDIDYQQQLYKVTDIPAYSAKAMVLPSLAEILYDVTLKKPVWRALKTLL